MWTADPSKSRVVIETQASGLLAAMAHDLRIEAPLEEASSDSETCTARFLVRAMRVVESCRHKTGTWHAPPGSDSNDIEGRIRSEVFEGCDAVRVEAKLEGERAIFTISAKKSQIVTTPVRVERAERTARVTGTCELSLAALGAGKVHVPLGAIKLDDAVSVRFDVTFDAA